jgi:sugar/nucleoside kinase (ribokinase family)
MNIQRLLYLGNVVVDIVLDVPALPGRGGDVLARGSQLSPGGGFNVMAAAARQGLPVAYAGAHGTGPFGDLARAGLAAEGIEVLQPARPDTDTGFVVAVVDDTAERTFVTSRGAEATLTGADLAGLATRPGDAAGLSGYSLVHPSNRGALLGWLARLPAENTVVFDPGPLVGSIPPGALDEVLGRADWLTCNAREAAALTGEDRPAAALGALADRLATRGRPGARVLVRTGPDGCLLSSFSATQPLAVPGFPVTARDSNGAGDTHTGVFIAALAAGANAAEAARRANAAAAISVTRCGPATAPTAAELAQFLSGLLNPGR